jgi:hypothetical protein
MLTATTTQQQAQQQQAQLKVLLYATKNQILRKNVWLSS